ncbi:MAG: proline dehydrogenase family protein [Phycisphaerae bacterium]|nr:proline dehydrogenase family protein [Phycisphaerae bacterium]
MSHSAANAIEQNTQRIGRELLESLRAAQPWPLQPAWVQERMLRQFQADPWLKVQAFRFIDALPAMSTSAAVARHLREYFSADLQRHLDSAHGAEADFDGEPNPTPVATASRPRVSSLTRFAGRWMDWSEDRGWRPRVTAWFAQKAALGMSGSFIAGSNIDEAERAILRMRKQSLAFTIDLLGEAALSPREGEHYHQLYLDLLDELPRRAARWPAVRQIDGDGPNAPPRINVSVKITAIYPGFDPIVAPRAKERAKEFLRPLLRKAMSARAHLHVDMEHYSIKDLTLELVRELFEEPEFRDYPHLGVVIQAYLRDGERDVTAMIDYAKRRGTPMWIRLVKGAYWDSEKASAEREGRPCPVWMKKWQSDACYERCAALLVENHQHIRTAFASHNIRSLAHAMALRDHFGATGDEFELQMLFGMGDPIKQALAARKERCRVYTPYGDVLPGMAYLIRRLLENTANESFLRQGADADVPAERLLRAPQSWAESDPPPPEDWSVVTIERAQRENFVNIPDTDFASPPARARFEEALRAVRATFGQPVPGLVAASDASSNGSHSSPPRFIESRNPSRPSEIIARVPIADAGAANAAIAAAARAFDSWSRRPARERAATMFEAAARLEARRAEFAARVVLEVGKTWREADAEVSEAIDYINYYAHQIRRGATHIEPIDAAGEDNSVEHVARGVCAVLGPWNFPLALVANVVSAAIGTGNTVVLKPASESPVIAAYFVQLWREAGLPEGVLSVVCGPGETLGPLLARHEDVDLLAVVGTSEAGVALHRAASETLTRRRAVRKVLLELSAKNAIIVDDDADLDEAVQGSLASAFGYAGQKCTAASRIIVVGGAHDRFRERFVDAARAMSLGPADAPGTSIPPLISDAAAKRVREWIAIGKREAKCVLEVLPGSDLLASGAQYVGPVVFDDVPASARIAREEVFGPVVALIRAANMADAIRIFNSTDYGLTGGVYSRSPANIELARRECRCGNLYINRKIVGSKVGRQPFGGVKLSGDGARYGGPDYLREFTIPRTITENTLRRGFAPAPEEQQARV